MEKRGPGRPPRVERKRGRPMSIPMQKMEVPENPGFHRHWLNDVGGRIQQALESGYTYVEKVNVELNEVGVTPGNTDLGSKVSMYVGTDEQGKPLKAYLMEIKQEWYDEDQEIIAQQANRVDEALKAGTSKDEHTYSKREWGSDIKSDFRTRR